MGRSGRARPVRSVPERDRRDRSGLHSATRPPREPTRTDWRQASIAGWRSPGESPPSWIRPASGDASSELGTAPRRPPGTALWTHFTPGSEPLACQPRARGSGGGRGCLLRRDTALDPWESRSRSFSELNLRGLWPPDCDRDDSGAATSILWRGTVAGNLPYDPHPAARDPYLRNGEREP